jgi:DNA-binding SARP family transcriptional activator
MLGGLHVLRGSDAPIAIRGDKTQALLAYLVLNRDRVHGRDRLSGMLWPDSTDEHARHSLRQAVLTLKKELEATSAAAILVADGHEIALDREAITVDVEEFERLAAKDSRPALQDAAALYRGELLEGLRSRSELFGDWLTRPTRGTSLRRSGAASGNANGRRGLRRSDRDGPQADRDRPVA